VKVDSAAVVSALLLGLVLSLAPASRAQQSGSSGTEPLSIATVRLARGALRSPYDFKLKAVGGLPPYIWQVSEGSLPPGLVLFPDGSIEGAPSEVGEFTFTIKVADGARPVHEIQKQFTLRVVTALTIDWSRPPAVNGQHIEGAVKVSNQTDHEADLTVVIVAVNEIGRATALGYQKVKIPADGGEIEVPFGQQTDLGYGSYSLNADAVAEVPDIYAIYRARLAPREQMVIQQAP
jgi:hypothetical protein